ncbi:MAG: glycosyltransferase [Planctomycetota bacterium]
MESDLNPSSQEHFGQTTVEALSAGVVPVVIDTGGQRETVEPGRNGFRWNTLEELATQTRQQRFDHIVRELELGVSEYPREFRERLLARDHAEVTRPPMGVQATCRSPK